MNYYKALGKDDKLSVYDEDMDPRVYTVRVFTNDNQTERDFRVKATNRYHAYDKVLLLFWNKIVTDRTTKIELYAMDVEPKEISSYWQDFGSIEFFATDETKYDVAEKVLKEMRESNEMPEPAGIDHNEYIKNEPEFYEEYINKNYPEIL